MTTLSLKLINPDTYNPQSVPKHALERLGEIHLVYALVP